MILGVPLERTPTEHRVALTPSGARILAALGHEVVIETNAGRAARFSDEEYRGAGAQLVYGPEEVFGRAELIMKVSALQPPEVALLNEGQTVLAFHHLAAASRGFLDDLLRRRLTLIGYEVMEDAQGDLPVLHAMSEIAGQLAVHVGAGLLETRAGGRGILLGGSTGIPAAHVVILGAGVVGRWAARTALGNGAQVSILDTSLQALRSAEAFAGPAAVTEVAHPAAVARAAAYADVLIGAVLLRGERAPHVVTCDMVGPMKPGSVVIDVSIDQGGCVETSRPTTLADPVFRVGQVTHYAVPNMCSAVARTASLALTYAALPLVQRLADLGLGRALKESRGLAAGVYLFRGELVSESVGSALGLRATGLDSMLDAPARAGSARV
jgi:alanine dehydrogenase